MNRIPVGQTIAQSYAFVFGRYFSLLEIIWLPYVLLGAANFLVMAQVMKGIATAAPETGHPDIFGAMQSMRLVWLVNLIALAFFAIMLVGVAREALGERRKTRFVYLRLTMDELRAAGAIFFLFAMLYAVMFGVAMIGALLGAVAVAVLQANGGSVGQPGPAAGIAEIIAIVAAFALVIGTAVLYVGVRLSFLFLPVTLVEKRFGLWRSWELMRGNFWRAVAIGFAVTIPILLINGAIFWFSMGPFVLGMMRHFGDPHAMTDQAQMFRSEMLAMWTSMPYLWAAGLAAAPIIYGLSAVPGVFAWRAMMDANGVQSPPAVSTSSN